MQAPTRRDNGSFVLSFFRDVYRLSAVKKAAYKFTDAFSITIDVENSNLTTVTLVPKVNVCRPWDALIGEFCNEVLDQDLRETIAEETNSIRDLILAQAFSEVSIFHPEFDRPSGQSPTDGGSNEGAEQLAEAAALR